MKMKFVGTLTLIVATSTLSIGALAQNLAIVNGKAIPKTRLDVLTAQVTRSGKPITPEMQAQLRDEVVTREIFVQEAQHRGLDTSDDYKNQMELAQQSILIRELFASYQKANPVTDAEIQAEYDKFVASNGSKEYLSRHILVENEADAIKLIAALKKGAKFDALAKKSSKDPGSGAKGGDLGWASPGNFVAEFSQALAALTKGKMTEAPVKSQFGYHIIRLDDIRDAQLPKLADVKPQVAQQLMEQKMVKFQEELRAKAKIE